MRIAILDSYYAEFLKTLKLGNGTYQEELNRVLAHQFGTSDYYSREFRKLGWEAIDIIANYDSLQRLAGYDSDYLVKDIALIQIYEFKPDVVFLQDLSLFDEAELKRLSQDYLLVAQCSCALPRHASRILRFHTILTSFPHYLAKLRELTVNAIYMPLAFHESTLGRFGSEFNIFFRKEPDIDCLFVGGIGWQWNYGRMVLEKVAAEIPGAQFYGYGFESLADSNPLKQKYKGTAWGDEMYALMQRAKVIVNRHGEISAQYANNMRMYEATGSGALLVTENKENLHELFRRDEVLTYNTPVEAVERIQSALNNWNTWGAKMAAAGQKRTLAEHTYAHRVPQIAKILENALTAA